MNISYCVWDKLKDTEVFFTTETAARVYFEAAVSAYQDEPHYVQIEKVMLFNGDEESVDIIDSDEIIYRNPDCTNLEITVN